MSVNKKSALKKDGGVTFALPP